MRSTPIACVHLGLAPRERMIRLETRGENRTRALSPDVKGRRPAMRALRPGAPGALRSTASVAPLLAQLRRAGLRARLSNDAGAYLCNAMYFWSLDGARRKGSQRPTVFVHLPWPAPSAGTMPLSRSRLGAPRPTRAELVRVIEAIAVRLAAEGVRGIGRSAQASAPAGRIAPTWMPFQLVSTGFVNNSIRSASGSLSGSSPFTTAASITCAARLCPSSHFSAMP